MKGKQQGPPALDLVEESVHLLRRSPLSVLGAYYVGAMPFVLALLYYLVDMGRGAFGELHAARGALALALLFVWMKAWQTVFTSLVRAQVYGDEAPRWCLRRVVRMVEMQAILQTTGFLVLPASALLMLPYMWAHAWYQNVTVFGDGEDNDLWKLAGRAYGQAKLWTHQGSVLIWLLSPSLVLMVAGLFLVVVPVVEATTPDWTSSLLMVYAVLFLLLAIPLCPVGIIVTLNVGMVIGMIPFLLEHLFGIENVVTLGGDLENNTFYAICCAITFLILDPVQKTAYTLRCFYGESLETGEDLRVALRQAARSSVSRSGLIIVMIFAACFGGAAAATADDGSVSAQELDQSIERVLDQREYAWRLDRRQGPEDETRKSALTLFVEAVLDQIASFLKWVQDTVERIGDWLRGFLPDSPEKGRPGWLGWTVVPRWTMYIILVVLACLLLAFVVRTWQRRGRAPVDVVATPILQTPDVADDSVGADALPEDGWLAMAKDLMDRGEWRLAMRALFLAGLALLARNELIRVAKYKSNREYERELARRAHAEPEILNVFSINVTAFERVWYGAHEASPELVRQFDQNQNRMRALAEKP